MTFTGIIWLLLMFWNGQTAEPISSQPACSECDYVLDFPLFDGEKKGVKPGDVICITGTWKKRITLRNIHGTAENPIIIRNCNGTARVESPGAFGLKFVNSSHIRLLGDGGQDEYGLVISTTGGHFLSMEGFTTDFEISRVEVAGPKASGLGENAGFAGFVIKTSPYEDCELFSDPTRKAWVMRNVSIHHNYIHDTGGEGMYIGHGFYKGRPENKCPDQGILYSHSIKNLEIYDNLLENIGYDGLQIKNADSAVLVHDNIVRNYGTKKHNAHSEGLFIGEGTTGQFYHNIIDSGTGNTCTIQGIGNLEVFENLFINAEKNGLYATGSAYGDRLKDGYFKICNNVICNPHQYGFLFYDNAGGYKEISHNLIINATPMTKKGAHSTQMDNRDLKGPSVWKTDNYLLSEDQCGLLDDTFAQTCRHYLQEIPDHPSFSLIQLENK